MSSTISRSIGQSQGHTGSNICDWGDRYPSESSIYNFEFLSLLRFAVIYGWVPKPAQRVVACKVSLTPGHALFDIYYYQNAVIEFSMLFSSHGRSVVCVICHWRSSLWYLTTLGNLTSIADSCVIRPPGELTATKAVVKKGLCVSYMLIPYQGLPWIVLLSKLNELQ